MAAEADPLKSRANVCAKPTVVNTAGAEFDLSELNANDVDSALDESGHEGHDHEHDHEGHNH